MPSINFFEEDIRFKLKDKAKVKTWVKATIEAEGYKLQELNYIFCSDDFLLDINRQYLQHDYYTDIITFDLSEPGQPINAEIYISVERVRDNARQFNSTLKQEIHRVIFHGALHLCGYGDKKPKEEVLMRKMEDKYLSLYFKG